MSIGKAEKLPFLVKKIRNLGFGDGDDHQRKIQVAEGLRKLFFILASLSQIW